MDQLERNKALFIGLSCVSVGCLIGSFAYPLQKLEIYKQDEQGAFNIPVVRTYVINENDQNYPYGYNKNRAKLHAQIHVDYKLQKILLLALAATSSISALIIGSDTVSNAEIDQEVQSIRSAGKKELLIEAVKHRMAMASKAQRSLFHEELKSLMEEYGSSSIDQEIMEADEINAIYEEQPPDISIDQSFRSQFPESMDESSWKAIIRGLNNGLTKEEIIKDVLGTDQTTGSDYISYLKKTRL